jgi:mannose-6-phosphate isomerase-like protein (cupin superfamily)
MNVDLITRTVVSLALTAGIGSFQQGAAPAKPADQKPTTSTSSTASTKVGSIDLTVTSLTGAVLADAKVSAQGPASREGTTSTEGEVVLTNIAPGTYRCRIQRDGFFTLEKEVVVRAGARTTAEATLSPAPPPPPPPAPATAPTPKTVAPTLVAGSPVTVSLVDQLADDLIKSKDPIAEHALGCSGATASKLIRLNDALPSQTHADADEIVYLIAGSATLTLNGKDQTVSAGWFSLIPRGMSHALKARGGKPVLVLSIQSGPACANSSAPLSK